MKQTEWTCPRCKKTAKGYGATSRRDNQTKVCSDCGTSEALFDWQTNQARQKGYTISEEVIQEEKAWLSG